MLPPWLRGEGSQKSGKDKKKSQPKQPETPEWLKPLPTSERPAMPSLFLPPPATTPKDDSKSKALDFMKDELGMKAGALSPAAELMKENKSERKKYDDQEQDINDLILGNGRTKETLRERGKNLKPREMTREEYLALPAEARAAVDFNSMLVDARARDRVQKRAGELPERQKNFDLGEPAYAISNGAQIENPNKTDPHWEVRLPKDYEDMFEKVFGKKPIKELKYENPDKKVKLPPIRPEVLSLLNQLQYETKDPGDMKDFLKLRKGISMADIDNYLLDKDKPKLGDMSLLALVGERSAKSRREKFVEEIAKLTLDLQERLVEQDKLIGSTVMSALEDRQGSRMLAGANVGPSEVQLGFGDTEADQLFRDAFESLLNMPDRNEFLDNLNAIQTYVANDMNLDPRSFMAFADTMLDNADKGGDLGTGKEKKKGKDGEVKSTYRTPDEYRELFGFKKVK